jgi:hypothetical protein
MRVSTVVFQRIHIHWQTVILTSERDAQAPMAQISPRQKARVESKPLVNTHVCGKNKVEKGATSRVSLLGYVKSKATRRNLSWQSSFLVTAAGLN